MELNCWVIIHYNKPRAYENDPTSRQQIWEGCYYEDSNVFGPDTELLSEQLLLQITAMPSIQCQAVFFLDWLTVCWNYWQLLTEQHCLTSKNTCHQSHCENLKSNSVLEASWNVMAHAQKPDFVFWRNGWVHLNRRGRQFSRLLAAEVSASAVVMLDTPCSEVVWRVLATHCIRQFPLHFPSCVSPCAITFPLESTFTAEIIKVQASWNVMAHAQKPDFVFRRNGRVHLNRPGASVQSTAGSWGVRVSGSNAGYTMFRGSVKGTGYPLHSRVSPSLPPPVRHCVPSHFNWSLPLLTFLVTKRRAVGNFWLKIN